MIVILLTFISLSLVLITLRNQKKAISNKGERDYSKHLAILGFAFGSLCLLLSLFLLFDFFEANTLVEFSLYRPELIRIIAIAGIGILHFILVAITIVKLAKKFL